MPTWIINTFTVVNTCLLVINLILLLFLWAEIEPKWRGKGITEEEKKGGGRPGKYESWYTHLENKLKSERKEKD